MKYFSMFSGIGGFELGIQQANEELSNRDRYGGGAEHSDSDRRKLPQGDGYKSREEIRESEQRENTCVGYSELDKYAIQIYEKHFKHKNYGDCTKITASTLPDFDLLVGGFPCQAFSIAGKREGFDDTRGTLFFDIARILKEKRPERLLLENVKGLLSHDQGRTFKIILSTLTELGYDIQAMVLNSKNFGVPQNRERVFIAGCLGGWGGKQVFSFGGANSKDIKEYKKVALNPSNYGTKGYIEGKNAIALSLPSGNNTTLIKQLNNPTHSNDRVYGADGVSLTLNTMQGGRRQPFVKIKEATKKGYVEAKEGDSINLSVPNSKTRRGRVGKGVAQTIDTGMQQYTLQEPKKELHAMRWQRTEKGKEARRESQKKGKDYTPFSDGHREVVPVEGKPVGALTAQAIAKDSLIGNKLQIRRLTPTECERLQGYPDGWTEGVSDTQRYKTLGNAVTVNVIREVMKNIL